MAEITRQHLINLHSAEDATLDRLVAKDFQDGEIAVQNAALAADSALYITNSDKTAVAKFIPEAAIDTKLDGKANATHEHKTAEVKLSEAIGEALTTGSTVQDALVKLSVDIATNTQEIGSKVASIVSDNKGINVSGDTEKHIELKVDNTGNVQFTIGENGLKGDVSGLDHPASIKSVTLSGDLTGSVTATTSSEDTTLTATLGDIDGNKITALTGYQKAQKYEAILVGDALNIALGKLEAGHDELASAIAGGVKFAGVKDALPPISEGTPGDLIIISGEGVENNGKEFIYTGEKGKGTWVELGDTTVEMQKITALEGHFDENGSAKKALDSDKAFGKTLEELKADVLTGKTSSATSADKLATDAAGSATQPVYFAGGVPVASDATVGGPDQVVYLKGGVLTAGNMIPSGTGEVNITVNGSTSTLGKVLTTAKASGSTITFTEQAVVYNDAPVDFKTMSIDCGTY